MNGADPAIIYHARFQISIQILMHPIVFMGSDQKTLHNHLEEMPRLAFLLNTDLKRGFAVAQMPGEHCGPEPLVWSTALEGKSDIDRFKALRRGSA